MNAHRRMTLFGTLVLLSLLIVPIAVAQDSTPTSGSPAASPVASPIASPIASPAASPVAVEPTPTQIPDGPPEGTPLPAHITTGLYPGQGSVTLVKVADGLESPRVITPAFDGTGRLFIGERYGTVRILTAEGELLPEPFIDIGPIVVSVHQDQGLLGIAFHPDYETNGLFYLAYTDYNVNGGLVVSQYRVSADDPNKADPDYAVDIIKIPHPTPILNGGTIHFGPNDGYLYIGSGNGAFFGVHDLFTAQEMDQSLGKILRINIVNDENGTYYTIPPDNPYNASYTYPAAPVTFAMGLRNPWSWQFDYETGDMYITDVGEMSWEEINFIPASSNGGQNFGWPMWEGAHCVNYLSTGSCPEMGTLPVAEYPHVGYGCAVAGVGVYRGDDIPFLEGFFLAVDYCTGKILSLSHDSVGKWQFQELADLYLLLLGGGVSEDGEAYVLSCDCGLGPGKAENNPGTVWKVVSTANIPEGVEVAPNG
ncbi:MAG: PQQ-dependent sugar dehydrogenase [Thermomicrobiales bacterium]